VSGTVVRARSVTSARSGVTIGSSLR